MKCPKCGKEIANNSKFCVFCGEKIVKPKRKVPKRLVFEIVLVVIIFALSGLLYLEHQRYVNKTVVVEAKIGAILADNQSAKEAVDIESARANLAEAEAVLARAEKEAADTRTSADKAKEEQLKAEEEATKKHVAMNYTENAYNINMKMVWVEGGTFMMGDSEEQGANYTHEKEHKVTLDGYYIGMYEIMNGQWERVMKTNISQQREKYTNLNIHDIVLDNFDYPMVYISWDDANAFCDLISKKSGNKYSLPTEAQWEYAARGGHKATPTKYAGSNDVDLVAWYAENSTTKGTRHPHPCGSKQANELGLFDMSGNVIEWCQDWFQNYETSSQTNPDGPSSGPGKIVRGGSIESYATSLRTASRYYNSGWERGHSDTGFRVVCNPSKEQVKLYDKVKNARQKTEETEQKAIDAQTKLQEAKQRVEEAQVAYDHFAQNDSVK